MDKQLIQRCLESETDVTCINGCQWRHGRNASGNSTEAPQIPLFTQDFCHPVTVTKDTPEADMTLCINERDPASCSLAQGCNWSDGKELIPENNFCAPAALTDDVAQIKTCLNYETHATCIGGC